MMSIDELRVGDLVLLRATWKPFIYSQSDVRFDRMIALYLGKIAVFDCRYHRFLLEDGEIIDRDMWSVEISDMLSRFSELE